MPPREGHSGQVAQRGGETPEPATERPQRRDGRDQRRHDEADDGETGQ
ncbi:hypothetical protein GJ629_12560 [Halapricum sp. CBA1109]|nr:hypothetical protein [Halapricum sp. CBA1109]MUV90627.1 hypothetical protein [Halapricum sp. CBA1109]